METQKIIFFLIVAFVILEFALEQILFLLNKNSWQENLPEQIKGIYDEEDYKKAREYARERGNLANIKSIMSFVILLVILLTGLIGVYDRWILSLTGNEILASLLFFGIAGFASVLLNLPFDIYSTFVIEEKYGFNKSTPAIFITDKIKSLLLAAVLGGGLLSLIVLIYSRLPDTFWIYAWALTTLVMVFFMLFYSKLIVPLFNKQTPLPDGDLKKAIEAFASKAGFVIDKIFVIDGSKRSTKANAYFTGMGKQKRIVLYDTLIKDHSVEEVVAVLAHEIGHNKLKHTTVSLIIGVLETGFMFYLLSLFITPGSGIFQAMGRVFSTQPSFHIGIMVFGLLYGPVSMLLSLLTNYISRKNEYAADGFAAANYSAEALGQALIKLSKNNLSNLTPHPAYVFFYYSHPTLLQRLDNMGVKTGKEG